jgi:PAS domain S-box-containing protein
MDYITVSFHSSRSNILEYLEADLHTEDLPLVLQKYQEAEETEATLEIEFRLKHKDGTDRRHLAHTEPIRDSNGIITGRFGTATPINEKKKPYDICDGNMATEKFRDLVEQTPFSFQLYSLNGGCIYANSSWERFWSTSREQVLGYNILEDIHAKDPNIWPLIEKAFQGKNVTLGDVYYDPSRNGRKGRTRWIRTHFFPVKDETGKLAEIGEVLEDVTDSKLLEERTSEAERIAEEFRALVEASAQIVWALDPNGQIVNDSPSWREFTGQTYEQFKEQGWINALHPEDQPEILKIWENAIKTETRYDAECRIRHVSGEWRWMTVRGVPLRKQDGSVRGWIGMNSDITGQKKTEEALRRAIRARDEFLSIASHELKTPLTSLKLQTQMRQVAACNHSKKVFSKEKLNSMFESDLSQIERLNRLIDDMLDISRISTGKLTIAREKFDFCEMVKEVILRYRKQLEEKGGEIRFAAHSPIIGNWDRLRLEQVLANLLTNAMRYGARKPVNVEVKATSSNKVRLSVTDQGVGIAKEDQERIFERFERAISANEASGLGLGLYIAKQIIEIHCGKIWIKSQIGHGSTFYVELPRDAPTFVRSIPPHPLSFYPQKKDSSIERR